MLAGEYSSNSEVIRDALRDWTHKRNLREQSQAGLRGRWQEAITDDTEGLDPDPVFERLEKKYEKMPEPATLMRLGLSPYVPGDLEGIADYIAQDSPLQALRMLHLLHERIKQIALQPQLDRIRPELGPDARFSVGWPIRDLVSDPPRSCANRASGAWKS